MVFQATLVNNENGVSLPTLFIYKGVRGGGLQTTMLSIAQE